VIRWLPRTEPIGGGGEATTIFKPCFLPKVFLDGGIRVFTLPAGFRVAAIAIFVLPIFGLCMRFTKQGSHETRNKKITLTHEYQLPSAPY
jgi:hypothetical protein